MNLQPVPGIPALIADDSLVITDLHIGVESHLRSKGFHLESRTDAMFDSIIEAAGDTAGRLIVLGDIKDSVPGSTKQEYREIPAFFDRLLEHFDSVDVIRGNHDTEIEEFLPGKVDIRPAGGWKLFDTGFVHGHTWPAPDVMNCKTLLMGHNHPSMMFVDGVKRRTSEPCWLRGSFKDVPNDRYEKLPESFIVVPAFNRMLGGSPVNVIGEQLLGPILNSDLIDADNARIFLLDGVCLGKRADLMVEGRGKTRYGSRN